jgi:hypothetical protein
MQRDDYENFSQKLVKKLGKTVTMDENAFFFERGSTGSKNGIRLGSVVCKQFDATYDDSDTERYYVGVIGAKDNNGEEKYKGYLFYELTNLVSVLSNRGIETQNPEFEDLLRILRERSLQESDCIALLKTKLVNGVVEFYVHAYLQECKNTITTEFESNPKVQDLRNLYKRLGNDSTVVELMGTLKETVRSYRDTLCAKI